MTGEEVAAPAGGPLQHLLLAARRTAQRGWPWQAARIHHYATKADLLQAASRKYTQTGVEGDDLTIQTALAAAHSAVASKT